MQTQTINTKQTDRYSIYFWNSTNKSYQLMLSEYSLDDIFNHLSNPFFKENIININVRKEYFINDVWICLKHLETQAIP